MASFTMFLLAALLCNYGRGKCLIDIGTEGFEVPRRGEPAAISLDSTTVKNYATSTAGHFRSKWPDAFKEKWPKEPQQLPELKYSFNLDEAKKLLAKKAAEEEPATD